MAADEMHILLFLVPCHFGLLAEEHDRPLVLRIADKPHAVTYMQDGVSIGHGLYALRVQKTADDEVHMR